MPTTCPAKSSTRHESALSAWKGNLNYESPDTEQNGWLKLLAQIGLRQQRPALGVACATAAISNLSPSSARLGRALKPVPARLTLDFFRDGGLALRDPRCFDPFP